MAKRLFQWARMISFGLSSFQLGNRRRRRRHALQRKFLTAEERWAILGNRLRKAAEKVVEQNE